MQKLARRLATLEASHEAMDLRLATAEVLLEAVGEFEANGEAVTIPDLLERIREEWEARAAGGTEPPALSTSAAKEAVPMEGG